MAGDWIKARASLMTHPKVLRISAMLEDSKQVGKKLSTGFGGALSEIVTRDVTRDVTISSLLRVWCAANEHTSDGVWHGIQLSDLDYVAGIPGFGDMMASVGWAVLDVEEQTVTFPNFLEYNAPAKSGERGKSAAERQRRYRERQKLKEQESVTDVAQPLRNSNVEKRREEKNNKPPPPLISAPSAETELVAVVDSLNFLGIMKTSCVQVASEAGCSPEHIRGLIEHYESHWRQIGWSSGALVHRIEHARPGMAIAEGWVPGKNAKLDAQPPVEDWQPAPNVECPGCRKTHRGNKRRKQTLQCVRCVQNFQLGEVPA